MRISFFEVENWEKRYLRRGLKGNEVAFYAHPLTEEGARAVKETEVLSTFIYSTVSRSVLDELPELKLVATRSTGYDHIDLRECQRRGVTVCNVPSYGENTVAEHTFALILSLSRNLCQACLKHHTGDFSTTGLKGFDLKGKTLGVVGTGRIGLHVIRIARGFGLEVLAYDAYPRELIAELLGFTYVPLEELLTRSHIVTLHVPYVKETHHLIDREKIRLMRRGAFLINTARGGVVDTEALIEALDSGILAGAGLDVLEGEEWIKEEKQVLTAGNKLEVLAGIGKNSILLRKPGVVYTPHVAFNSQEALERILATTADNIVAFLAGSPRNVVTF